MFAIGGASWWPQIPVKTLSNGVPVTVSVMIN